MVQDWVTCCDSQHQGMTLHRKYTLAGTDALANYGLGHALLQDAQALHGCNNVSCIIRYTDAFYMLAWDKTLHTAPAAAPQAMLEPEV